jgi:hypothetical protein
MEEIYELQSVLLCPKGEEQNQREYGEVKTLLMDLPDHAEMSRTSLRINTLFWKILKRVQKFPVPNKCSEGEI